MIQEMKEKELSLWEIFKSAWSVYKKTLTPILIIALLFYTPVNVIYNLIPDTIFKWNYLTINKDFLGIFLGFITLFVPVSIALIVEKALLGEFITYKEALKISFSKWFCILKTNIIGGIIVLLLCLLLIVPGIIWATYYFFSDNIVALKNLDGKEALDYSKSLVKGRGWKVFGFLLISPLLTGLFEYFLENMHIQSKLFSILEITFSDIIGTFFLAAATIFFLNLDYIKEQDTNNV